MDMFREEMILSIYDQHRQPKKKISTGRGDYRWSEGLAAPIRRWEEFLTFISLFYQIFCAQPNIL